MKCIFPKHEGLQIKYLCCIQNCNFSSRLLCDKCLEKDHIKHKENIINIDKLKNTGQLKNLEWGILFGENKELEKCLKFVKENIFPQEKIDERRNEIISKSNKQLDTMFENFKKNMIIKLDELKIQMQLKCEYNYLQMINNIVDLKKDLERVVGLNDVQNFIQSYSDNKISHNALKLILKEFFEQQQENFQDLIQKYKKLSKDSENHNYLEVIDFDQVFWQEKQNRLLSFISDFKQFEKLIPEYKLQNDLKIIKFGQEQIQLEKLIQLGNNDEEKSIKIKQIEKFYQNFILINNGKQYIQVFDINSGKYVRNIYISQTQSIKNFFVLRNEQIRPYQESDFQLIVIQDGNMLHLLNERGKQLKTIKLNQDQLKIKIIKPFFVQTIDKLNLKTNLFQCYLVLLDKQGDLQLINTYLGNSQEIITIKNSKINFVQTFWDTSVLESLYKNQFSSLLAIFYQGKYFKIMNPFSGAILCLYDISQHLHQKIFQQPFENFQICLEMLEITENEKSSLKNNYKHLNQFNFIAIILISDSLLFINWNNSTLIKKVELYQPYFSLKILKNSLGSINRNLIILFNKSEQNQILLYDFIGGASNLFHLESVQGKIQQVDTQNYQRDQKNILFAADNQIGLLSLN